MIDVSYRAKCDKCGKWHKPAGNENGVFETKYHLFKSLRVSGWVVDVSRVTTIMCVACSGK